ncbi:hypothetical protein BHE74_00003318 [Ensete ventricosum]|nr:hypothetical protein BHE74_00003318 [Ensete ventricosum]
MAKHHGESSKMGQAGPLHQAAAGGLQVQTRSQTAGAAHEERGSEQGEREVGYSPRAEEAQYGAPTGKRSHKERLTAVETNLDVLEANLEELYQGQGRILGVESSQEEVESRIERVKSLVDRLIEDTKDSVRHLHEVVAELTAKVTGHPSVAKEPVVFSLDSGRKLRALARSSDSSTTEEGSVHSVCHEGSDRKRRWRRHKQR